MVFVGVFGVIYGCICIVDEFFEVIGMVGKDGNVDVVGDEEFVVFDEIWFGIGMDDFGVDDG